jgi:hypothetical protein
MVVTNRDLSYVATDRRVIRVRNRPVRTSVSLSGKSAHPHRNRGVPAEHEERAPPRLRMLDSPDLAPRYQGSGLIAASAASNAHPSGLGAGTRE